MGPRADSQSRIAAIYARVSSERQRQEQTIHSQTAALRELAEQRGLVVPEELVFEDDGFSGANFQRPALEQLRDRAFDGCFEIVLCHAPDGLARRYAYQVLLLEELARSGIEVIFAKEPERSGSPEDELLRHIQGMIAEYERAQIAERCRHGKLHRARAGAVSVLSNALRSPVCQADRARRRVLRDRRVGSAGRPGDLRPLHRAARVDRPDWPGARLAVPPEVRDLEGFDPSFASDFWDRTNRQDFAACVSVMRGLRSAGYRPGPFDRREAIVHAFQAMIARAYLSGGLERPVLAGV